MRAFTRKPQPHLDGELAEAISELIVVDETDTLAPIGTTAQLRAEVVEPERVRSIDVGGSPLSSEALAAYHSLLRFAAASEPVIGWRRCLFALSGIVLGPGRAERELREQVRLLLDSVGSMVIDATKETAS